MRSWLGASLLLLCVVKRGCLLCSIVVLGLHIHFAFLMSGKLALAVSPWSALGLCKEQTVGGSCIFVKSRELQVESWGRTSALVSPGVGML